MVAFVSCLFKGDSAGQAEEIIRASLSPVKVAMHKCPGESLYLDQLFFDNYNKVWANGREPIGVHRKETRERMEKFREEQIIPYIENAHKEEVWKTWLQEIQAHPIQFDKLLSEYSSLSK